MRGKDGEMLQVWKLTWITPAYAGKRPAGTADYHGWRDHPRLCGEKIRAAVAQGNTLGSPPPMRGKADSNRIRRNRNRITPAYAGKSGGIYHEKDRCKDHPRLCGEKFPRISHLVDSQGSPPPMRGKAAESLRTQAVRRITPAYAGKRDKNAFSVAAAWDHPRLCGEKHMWAEILT